MTDDELRQIEARANAATPGPWRGDAPYFRCLMDHEHGRGQCRFTFTEWVPCEHAVYRDPGYTAETVQPPGAGVLVAGMWDYEEGGIESSEDAAFIAAARTDVPRLVAEVRALNGLLADLCQDSAAAAEAVRLRAAIAKMLEADTPLATDIGRAALAGLSLEDYARAVEQSWRAAPPT